MNNNNNNNNPKQVKRRRFDILFFILIVAVIVLVYMLVTNLTTSKPTTLTIQDFETSLTEYTDDSGAKIEQKITGGITATPAGSDNPGMYVLSGTFKNTKDGKFRVYVTSEYLTEFTSEIGITYKNVTLSLTPYTENVWLNTFLALLPELILMAIFIFVFYSLMKAQGGANGGAMDFAKSPAQLSRQKTVTFKDVAGCDEEKEELVEIIDFLKNPRKYNEIGARVPKGVLLFGPPGTGKTLLAKAVAGEAGVPFFSISGSDFVEMFVGVGAARVRDMFKTAKQNAPCIIFIDEIDAVGRQRGAGMGGGHDEREQTLNQILVEMDGFSGNTGIIMMAATNRPDVLDPALLRPGRFDRQITISNPDVRGREEILKVHARNKHLDPAIKLSDVAQRTPGFSGAELENVLNEAALLTARHNDKVITIKDIDEAIDRVMMGPAKKSRKYTEAERRLVAYHEAGHAVVGIKLENASQVQKITIVPRGQAGGYNLMMPKEETYFTTKTQMLETITGFLGGRVAEELMFHEVSSGASNDFQNATKLARSMVTEYGMSDLGPVQYEQQGGSVFLGRDYLKEKNFSDQVALEIDNEVRKIIEECYEKAKEVISSNMDLLANIAEYLLKIETITKPEIDEIVATGHLKWYDDKQAADAAAKAAEAAAAAPAEPAKTPDVIVPEVTAAPEVKTPDEPKAPEENNDTDETR